MRHSSWTLFLTVRFLVTALAIAGAPLRAAVVILVNKTEIPIKYAITHPGKPEQAFSLAAGDQEVVPSEEQISISFTSNKTPRRYKLAANTIHLFLPKGNTFDLQSLEMPMPPSEEGLPPPNPRIIDRTTLKLPVKVLADSAQPAVQKVWEKEFRGRIAQASKIFEDHCGITLKIVAVETWESDNSIVDFSLALREFETKVNPAPSVLAIGFASQYQQPDGETHLGGTRGPMYPFLLCREWSQHVSKNERLEIMTHELGHFFGAVHSGLPDSLMRPKLGDRLSNLAAFRIGFDPLNTLAMNIMADELRAGPYRGLHRMPIDARRQLLRIYYTLSKELPKDPAAPQYIAMLNLPVEKPKFEKVQKMNLAEATKTVVKAIADASQMNSMSIRVYEGDDLTEFYVRRAAMAAMNLPPEVAADAFLLGLGIGLNDALWVRNLPSFGPVCRQVEANEEFSDRLKQLGQPTLRGRHDLALHFMLSAALTVHIGRAGAEKAGLTKELADSERESGFSFIDLTADLSGIAFAEAVRGKKITFDSLTDAFPAKRFLPEFSDLKESISCKDFEKTFGSLEDVRFKTEYQKIKDRVKQLPGLKPSPPDAKR